MAVSVDQRFQAGLGDPDKRKDSLKEYKRWMLEKILFLLKDNNLPDEDLAIVKRLIIQQNPERFDRVKSWDQSDYFQTFVGHLDITQVENLYLKLDPILAYRARTNSRTAGVYYNVFHNMPLPTTTTAVEEAYNVFGQELFTKPLEREARRQHELALQTNNGIKLSPDELEECGWPLGDVFANFIPRINDLEVQRKFTASIRKHIRMHLQNRHLDPVKYSTHQLQIDLRYAAKKVADALWNLNQKDEAEDLYVQAFGREKADAWLQDKKAQGNAKNNTRHSAKHAANKTLQPKPKSSRRYNFRSILDSIVREIVGSFAALLPFKLPVDAKPVAKIADKPRANVAQAPITPMQTPEESENYDTNASQNMIELFERLARLEGAATTQSPNKSDNVPQGITHAFKTRNKPAPHPLPAAVGPNRPKLFPQN